MPMIVLVEDDDEVGRWLRDDLGQRGYEVTWLRSGDGASGHVEAADLVVLDVMLPGLDGFSVGRRLKSVRPELPIVMLSARGAIEDRLTGLQFADDYLTKPFHPDELAARIEIQLRRRGPGPIRVQHLDVYLTENRIVDRETAREVALTGLEHRLLSYLLSHPRQVLTKEQLLEEVWGPGFQEADNSLMVHIRHLRQKLERDPGEPTVLQTVRGLGYRVSP